MTINDTSRAFRFVACGAPARWARQILTRSLKLTPARTTTFFNVHEISIPSILLSTTLRQPVSSPQPQDDEDQQLYVTIRSTIRIHTMRFRIMGKAD